MNTRTMLKWCVGIVLAIAVLSAVVLPQSATAGEDYPTRSSAYYLRHVHHIGSEIGNPETLQALMIHESRGDPSAIGNPRGTLLQRSYGLMQVQIVAARSILKRHPELVSEYFDQRAYRSVTDREIAKLLIDNPIANITIGAYHFNLYLKLSKGNWHRAVAANNVGIGAVQSISRPAEFSYVREVQRKLNNQIKPFNKTNGLSLTQAN